MPGPVAITGATGFAGRHVVRFLGQQGAPMRLLMRKERNDLGFESHSAIVSGRGKVKTSRERGLGSRPSVKRVITPVLS